MTVRTKHADPLDITHRVVDRLSAVTDEPRVAVEAWTGDRWGPEDADATIVLNHPGALRALMLPLSDLTAGEAYIHDDIDIRGSIRHVLRFAASLESLRGRRIEAARVVRELRRLPKENRRSTQARPATNGRLHSKRRDKQAVTAHYDTGNEFFAQFLDPAMVYSAAAFLDPDEPLEVAQRRKLDLICRKLQLEPGQRLLDIGCGWGALGIHAAGEFGVDVVGVTLSEPQASEATRRASEAGLADRTEFRVLDYRDVEGRFDAVSSVGMFEHVGGGELGTYFSRVRQLLEPDGVFLNHGIVTRQTAKGRRRPTFINTHVFPDSELVPVDEVVRQAETAGFELRDAESLRTSYAHTLRHWVDNLEANRMEAVASADERTYRVWRLYMAGSELAFARGSISVYQLLLRMPERSWTFGRRHLLATDDRDRGAALST